MKIIANTLLLITSLFISINTQAKGVAAGTVISNTVVVTANALPEGGLRATAEFTVAEVLNLDLLSLDNQYITVFPSSNDRLLTFQLSNTGNGVETFSLNTNANITGDDFDPRVTSIWLESNSQDGLQNSGTGSLDTPYSTAITLAADESVIIYVLSSIPDSLDKSNQGKVRLTATSTSEGISNYKTGQSIPNSGDNGIELVLLQDYGQSQAVGTYIISDVNINMTKTVHKIVGPYGKTRLMSGSAVTYKILVSATGNGEANNLTITDPTPANMTYQPGSMVLNSITLSDVKDTDQGDFNISNTNTATLSIGNIKSSEQFEFLLTYVIN